MASATVKSYVKSVYRLSRIHADRPVTTGRLAEAMRVSPGTVTSMLKTLHDAELVRYTPYEGVRLTEAGERMALRGFRRHRLLECFLCESLGLEWDKVHEDAERMEHHLSDFLVERIDDYLGHPKFDPHGDPIPAADGTVPTRETQPLVDCPAGTQFRLARVTDQSSEFLRYLTQSGLSLGTTASVAANRVEAGIMVLAMAGQELTLSHEAAAKLMVTLLEPIPKHDEETFPSAEPLLNDTTLRDTPGAAH